MEECPLGDGDSTNTDSTPGRGRRRPEFRIAFQPLQISPQLRGVLITQVSIFFHGLVDDPFQLGWYFVIQPHRGQLVRCSPLILAACAAADA